MYVNITGSPNNKDLYIYQSYRKENGKTSSRIHRKLGKVNELLEKFDGDYDAMMEWAKAEAAKDTAEYNANREDVILTLSQTAYIPKSEERSFNVGYLFLQKLCSELRLEKICQSIMKRHKFKYDLNAILTDLIYARILCPSSKLSSYEYSKGFLEPPKYSLQNLYRSLSVMSLESDFIQEELYRNSNFVSGRNTTILYYDCTNYYFEIEQEDGIKKYGKSKENRPNPIVTMGLFMDADGIPLAFDIFPGNQNEQTTLRPLETKIIRDFGCSKFIYCSDAGLGSKDNKIFNSMGNRAYIITQSLKKLKKEEKELALRPTGFCINDNRDNIDIRTLDESEPSIYNSVYYKIMPTGNDDEMLIVTYSPKYKAYQRKIRAQQIGRAMKLIDNPSKTRCSKNQNDPARFVKKAAVSDDGELIERYMYDLDSERIAEEERYDGFYAVVTNLDGDIHKILEINRRRWEIEENFRIMKTEFEARPVYVRREDSIRAHFLTCYISLLVYRLLEKRLSEKYTCREILETIRKMSLTLLNKDGGYVPSYKRTELTDDLHEAFGFRTDHEFTTKVNMRNIIKKSKEV